MRASEKAEANESQGHPPRQSHSLGEHHPLRAGESLYRTLAANLPGGALFVVDQELRYILAEGEALATAGMVPEDLEGNTIFEALEPHLVVLYEPLYRQALTGERFEWEHHSHGRDYLSRGVPLVDEDGKIYAALALSYDITERKQAEEALSLLNEQLEERVAARTRQVRELAAQLTMAEHEERARIAQILHDDLQQQLYAMQIHLQFLRGEAAGTTASDEMRGDIAEMEALVAAATETTRQLSVDLSPPVLEGEGLAAALGWLATRMQEQFGLRVELEAIDACPVPEMDRRVLLFRMVRELLFNAVKHAGVDRATVRLGRENCVCRIDVVDEGSGFDPQAVLAPSGLAAGRGLLYVRQRLQLVGGRLEIESAPARGTCVTIMVPPGAEVQPEEATREGGRRRRG